MSFTYSTSLIKVRTTFNNMYKNNEYVPQMPAYTDFNMDITKCLRKAVYYEIYKSRKPFGMPWNPKLTLNDATIDMIDVMNHTYIGQHYPLFILVKMFLYVKHFLKDDDYDLSDLCTAEMQDALNRVLQELNVADQVHQTIYTLNMLFSDEELFINLKTTYNMADAKRVRKIQQWVNNYITQPGKLSIPYFSGLLSTEGHNTQIHEVENLLGHGSHAGRLSLYYLSLIFQDASNWLPMDLDEYHLANRLVLNDISKQAFKNAYYLIHHRDFSGNDVTPDDVRTLFYFKSGYVQNLSMEPIVHLDLSKDSVVQAFYLNDDNSNNYHLYTIQYPTESMSDFSKHPEELITIGSFNPTDVDSLYNLPNYAHGRHVKIEDNISKNTDPKNKYLAAHTQTFAPISKHNNKYLIGIYRESDTNKHGWAKMFGLFDLDNSQDTYNDINQIHILKGFDAYRLEASTDLDNNLLIIQTISEDHKVTFKKYWLDNILLSMKDNLVTDIKDFASIDTYTIPAEKNIIKSFQGFVYDKKTDQLFISSQIAPQMKKISQDQHVPVPNYDQLRAIYAIKWGASLPEGFHDIPLTNMYGVNIKQTINLQVQSVFKPVTFATEIESNLLAKNNSVYQMIAYHWSDNTLVKQPNINTLVKISWEN